MLLKTAPARLNLRSAMILAFLIIAAFTGNYFHLHLFVGTGFIFGSVATLLVVRLYGPGLGVVAGLAGASAVLVESGLLYVACLLALEPLLVGWALLRGRCNNIAVADGAFWLLLGMPLLLVAELGLNHDELYTGLFIALILGFNGIFNALIASLFLDYLPVHRWFGMPDDPSGVPLRHLAFNLLASFLVSAMFLIILLNGKDEVKQMNIQMQTRLNDISVDVASRVSDWRKQHLALIRHSFDSPPSSNAETSLLGDVSSELHELRKIMQLTSGKELSIILLDHQRHVVTHSSDETEVSQHLEQNVRYEPAEMKRAIGFEVGSQKALALMRDGLLVREVPVDAKSGWTLHLELPVRSYFDSLQRRLVNDLGLMWGGLLLAFVLASVISRRLIEPLERLVAATGQFKFGSQEKQELDIERSRVQEIDSLIRNFGTLIRELNFSYSELDKSHATLEEKVTERTRELSLANQQLEETTTELVNQKFALDQHSIVAISDPKGEINYANDKFCEISQYSRDELLGQDYKILNSGYHGPSFFSEMWNQIGAGKVWRGEICNRNKNGASFWVDMSIVPFMDVSGKPYQYVSISTDITLQKQAMLDLMQARDEAETANQAKSEFLSCMSHELRTPLNAILGFGQLLESDYDDPLTPSQLENVEHITKAGWHLLELVNEVLDLARIESGRMRFNLSDVLLSEVAGDCLDLILPMSIERGIRIDDQITSCRAHFVRADRIRLKQVLLNFLSNAVKYNHEGGLVTMACEQLPEQRLRVSISDTGPGIPEVEMDQLFVPFNRLGADKTETQGAGIGLSVSKRLVELMGGVVGVKSVVGEGTTFWMDLPESVAETSSDHADNEVNDAAAVLPVDGEKYSQDRKRHVLYIEDNPDNCALVKSIIRQKRPDLDLVCEGSAEEGLQTALRQHPDVILMDINLPGISGMDALELLAEFDDVRDIPVIAVSANAMPDHIEKCLQAGFLNYLTKPINVDQFLFTLDHALNVQKIRVESV